MGSNGWIDEKSESRLYVGNLDLRITEASLIKMFSPYGKILSEDFLWHTRGPKRGEPRGFAFIQYDTKEVSGPNLFGLFVYRQALISTFKVSMQEAKLAKEKMHGRLACGRPLVVRLASEKCLEEAAKDSSKVMLDINKAGLASGTSAPMSRSTKIAAIKNKLKALEEDPGSVKKQKQAESISCNNSLDLSFGKRR